MAEVNKITTGNKITAPIKMAAGNNPDGINDPLFNNTVSTTVENPILNSAGNIMQSLGAIKKQGGPAVGLIGTIEAKVKALINSYMNKIDGLNQELEAIQGNPNEKDVNNKVKEIKAKIDALQKEGMAKMQLVAKIASCVPKLNSVMQNLMEKNIPTNVITDFLNKVLNGISSNPSNFDGKEADPKKIDEIIKKGVLGNNDVETYSQEEEKTKARIQELKSKQSSGSESPKNTPFGATVKAGGFDQAQAAGPDNKDAAGAEIEALEMKLDVIKTIKEMFSSSKN